MSDNKPPSLPIPSSGLGSSQTPSHSILNGVPSSGPLGSSSAQGSGPKSKTPTSTTPTPLQSSHVLPQPQTSQYPSHSQTHHSSQQPGPYPSYPQESGYLSQPSQQPYVEMDQYHGQHHLSQPQQQHPQTSTSGPMYGPGPQVMQPSYQAQHPGPSYPYRYSQANGVSSPNQPSVSTGMGAHMLPLPTAQLTPTHSPLNAVHPSQNSPGGPLAGKGYRDSSRPMDTTGQIAPPGAKPQVTAMLWEDEGSLCFQVEANGVCVARREAADNHMINGTKLLNVAGMTRGRRDGILKSEKQRHVVKIGPMHLKGVWIPFERALDFANKEKITELLYPLFVHNISALMYHPMNSLRTNAILQAVERKRMEQQPPYGQPARRNPSDLILSSSQPPPLQFNSMQGVGPQYPMNGGMQHGGPMSKPEMGRSLSFPTPPGGNGEANYWNGSQSLGIDTGVGSRSMPATPATTPPGNSLNQMQQYPAQSYGEPRPAAVASYPQSMQPQLTQSMARFGGPLPQPNTYMEQGRDMAPPPSHQNGSRPSSRQNEGETKDEGLPQQSGIIGEVVDEQQPVHYQSAPEHESERKDDEYGHSQAGQSVPAGYTTAPRGSYYNPEHTPHLSPDLSGSPSQQGAGTPNRGAYSTSTQPIDPQTGSTPRTATAPQQQWLQQTSAYNTSPRGTEQALPRPPARALYSMEGERDSQSSGYASQGYMNGSSNKRIRELDEDDEAPRPASRESDVADAMTMKRRKTMSQGSLPNINPGAFDQPQAINSRV